MSTCDGSVSILRDALVDVDRSKCEKIHSLFGENATIDEVNEILRTLDSKISQLKHNVVQSLHTTFVLYETDVDRVVEWYTEILDAKEQADKLENQLGQDKQILHSANEDLEIINCELGQCQASIVLLKSLVDIVKNLERADPADYYNAARLIKESEDELASIASSFQIAEDHIWIKQLRARFTDLVVDVYDKCRKEWGSLFRFDNNTLTIYPHAANIEQLITSLRNIKSFSRVWEKFLNMLWQELFKPACSTEFKIEVCGSDSTVSLKYEADDVPTRERDSFIGETSFLQVNDRRDRERDVSTVIRAKKLDKPFSNAVELFGNLTALVAGINSIFCDNPAEMASLANVIGPKICNELANKYLKTLILQRCGGDIEIARADVAHMKKFVTYLADEMNFHFPDPNIFQDIDANFDILFKSQVREALIVKLRDLIKSDVHNSEEINYEVSIPNSKLSAGEIILLRKNPALFPRCIVSKSIAELVKLLKEHMTRYPKDVGMSASVLSLYLALVKIPKHEADAGELVPLTSVLIHNNSLFLAHHAGYTFELCDDMVPDLRAKASQAIAFMMRSVRSKLNELISTAMSSIEERVDRNIDITHDFLVITAELKRLNTVMSGVLPPLSWHDILATLVDHTTNEMCSKVLAWDDIPANSASELATAFTQFAVATSSLFKGDASTPREIEALTSRAVKKWQRFKLLIFVLTASMKEIESKWVGGCGPLAIEYSAEEVRRLIRALFQNTDRRAAFLTTIK
ncbi:Centromere/kinetochore protein zw10 [Orchesella cincta]|uniref:Centromere/kinetochore protein zw10 n=1 Tax=Orchesella cincta TaxID=48709 RepID=A0A1D2MPL9_ORCCI|nr:Centromere/kinetochore protein zw10 [Orchesella cincta]